MMMKKTNLILFLVAWLVAVVQPETTSPLPPEPCGLSPIPLDISENVTVYTGQLGQATWQVSVQVKQGGIWKHACGGTVIGRQAVLTAASCVASTNPGMVRTDAGIIDLPKGWFVRAGFPGMQKPGQAYTEAIKTHPLFDKTTLANNLAVLRLATALDFVKSDGNISNACLPAGPTVAVLDSSAGLFVSGWGSQLISGVTDLRQKLQIRRVQLVSDCPVPAVNLNEICVSQESANENDEDDNNDNDEPLRCEGDLGGPLFSATGNGTSGALLVAVASRGTNCTSDDPYIFTEVFPHLQWIRQASKPYY